MLKMFKKNEKKNKGFTLVELIIVIAILAVLVGILAPQYVKYVDKSKKSADANNIDNVVQAIKVASADDEYVLPAGKYTVTLSNNGLEIKGSDDDTNAALTKNEGTIGALTKALIEYLGTDQATYDAGIAKYTNTKLKYQKWDSTVGKEITATATVSETGAVSVGYKPADFAAYVGVQAN